MLTHNNNLIDNKIKLIWYSKIYIARKFPFLKVWFAQKSDDAFEAGFNWRLYGKNKPFTTYRSMGIRRKIPTINVNLYIYIYIYSLKMHSILLLNREVIMCDKALSI